MKPATMDSLAPEIILAVFTHLNATDILNCALVCRSWARITNDALLWFEQCVRHAENIPGIGGGFVNVTNDVAADPASALQNFKSRIARRMATRQGVEDDGYSSDEELLGWFRAVDWRLEYRWRAMNKLRVRAVPDDIQTNISVHSIEYDQESALVLTVSDDGFLKYWKPLNGIDGDYTLVKKVALSQDVTGSIRIPGTGGAYSGNQNVSFCNNLGMSKSRGHVYSAVLNQLQQRDLETGTLLNTLTITCPNPADRSFVTAIHLPDPSGTVVVTGSSKNFVELWDLRVPSQEHNPLMRFYQEGTVLCLEQPQVQPHTLLCGGRFNSLNLYDIRAQRLKKAIFSGSHMFSLCNFNGATMVGGGHNKGRGVVEIYDLRRERMVSRSRGGINGVGIGTNLNPRAIHQSVVFGVSSNAPTHSRLATCSGDGTVLLWDESGRHVLRDLLAPPLEKPVTGVRMGQSSVAVASVDEVCVIDLAVPSKDEEMEDETMVMNDIDMEQQREEEETMRRGMDMQRMMLRFGLGF